MQIITNNLFIACTVINLHPFLSAVVSDHVEPSFEEAPPSPNHSDPDLPPNRHEMDPVPPKILRLSRHLDVSVLWHK